MKAFRIGEYNFGLYKSAEELHEIVKGLANRINNDYEGRKPVFLIVMKGAFIFAADLIRQINLNLSVELIRAKSYGSSMTSSGKVQLQHYGIDIKGRDVIIVEDIVDSGLTMEYLMAKVRDMGASSVEAAALISKTEMRKTNVDVKYTGMDIPPLFVIGYGLDYDEQGRHLPDLYMLNEEK